MDERDELMKAELVGVIEAVHDQVHGADLGWAEGEVEKIIAHHNRGVVDALAIADALAVAVLRGGDQARIIAEGYRASRIAAASSARRGVVAMSKQKRYVARIYLGRDENGKQQFDWIGRFDLKRERDAAVARRRVKLEQEQTAEFPTCDQYVDRYLAEYARTHKDSSHSTTKDRLQRFRTDFEGESLDVPRHAAKDWANTVPAGCVHAVITMYNHAIDEDDLPLAKNPFRKLGDRGKGRADTPPPTEAEFQAILEACAVHKGYAPRMRAFLLFAAFTLMRPSELFALEWGDVDFEAMRIAKARRLYRGKLAEPKTGPKTIALTPPARDAILGQPRDSRYVFTSKTGKRLSSTNLWGYWNVVRARAGLDFDFYQIKHYGVHEMYAKMGMSRRAIAAQAGWSVRSVDKMLRVYAHEEIGALDEVDAAFEQQARKVTPLRRVEGGA